MAKKITKKKQPTKKNATSFKAGNKSSVGHGRPKMSATQKELSITTRTKFKTILQEYSALTLEQIKKHLDDQKLPVIDLAVLRNLEYAVEAGSMDRIDWTLNHMLGKQKEEQNINLRGTVESTSKLDIDSHSKEELLVLQAMMKKSK